MTKEELIEKLIKARRRDTTERSMRLVCLDIDCTECPHMKSSYCSADIIDDLLDHIIDNETPKETNLEHYWDNLNVRFNPRQIDGYLAFVESNMEVKKWLLQPYQPKQRYMMDKLTYGIVQQWAEVNEIYRSDKTYGSDLFDILFDLGLWNDSWGDVNELDMWEFAENAEVMEND